VPGIGPLVDGADGILAVGWGESTGAAAYSIAGSDLHGTWAVPYGTDVGSESLVRV
jgi:hypothetical protein